MSLESVCVCVQMCLRPCIILTTSLCIFQEKCFGLDVYYLLTIINFTLTLTLTLTKYFFLYEARFEITKKNLVKYIFRDMDET